MTISLDYRLNQILPRVTSKDFLSNEGIGNEIAFYVFDYPAQEELRVREHIEMLMARLESHHQDIRVLHLDLLDVILDYLKQRGLFEKALKMEAAKNGSAVLRALKGPLAAAKISDFIAREYSPADFHLVFLSGVGSAWPMLRAHSLLNSLHKEMDQTPLVMFYPGTFDGTTLRLFGQINSPTTKQTHKPYYRAFILVPGGAAT